MMAVGEVGQWEVALDLLSKMPSPDIRAYNIGIMACGEAEKPDKCHDLFTQLAKKGLKPDQITYSSLLHALGTNLYLSCSRTQSSHRKVYFLNVR